MGFRTRLIVLSMAAILWCATVIDVAADEEALTTLEGVKTYMATLQLQAAGEPVNPSNLEKAKRVIEAEAEKKVRRFCRSDPCGWATYVPFSRRIEFTLKNYCKCPDSSFKCIRTGDDVTARTYIYHCRKDATDQDIEFKELEE